MEKEKMLRVGVVTTTHGVRGEVKVFPTTDDAGRFKQLKKAYLDLGNELLPVTVEGVKFFKQTVIVKFKEIGDMDQAALYRNKDILIEREDAVPLEENEFYICDLIGLSVVADTGESLGVLTDVLKTGANDVFEVTTTDKKTVLIPYIEDCVKEISLEESRVFVHILPGLLD
ncbi:MAG: 16S rRNA processing protein RimM [Lachnospiraceae bacterium]|nr:16S rRNA processing protein RimM [Lachnospiraceae bacterium]